jgi:hypothetical protein
VGGLANDLATTLTGFTLPSVERGIHPDIESGLPIAQTSNTGYPDYFFPRLNGLVFSVGLQVLVEISPMVQYVFSANIFLAIFPHIFTIYLIHGFIFWSVGAAICVQLNALGWPYWANMLVVAVVCYTILFLSLPLLTPIVETLGKNVTANIWLYAHVQPTKKQNTLFPFEKNLFFEERDTFDDRAYGTDDEKTAGKNGARVSVDKV